MFPRYGFTIYESADLLSGSRIHTDPFFNSLDHESFIVKEKKDGFCLGNFMKKPYKKDFYLLERELSNRDLSESIAMAIFCFIPMVISNLVRGVYSKKNP